MAAVFRRAGLPGDKVGEMKKRFAVLQSALWEKHPVRVTRRAAPKESLSGFVVGMTDAFVLLHVEDAAGWRTLDGYVALPLREVKSARVYDDHDCVFERVLALKGMAPQPQPDVFLGDLPGLLSSLNTLFPLVTLHAEYRQPDLCFIGRMAGLKKKAVAMRLLSPAARWYDDINTFRFADITRVDFGSRYEADLWELAEQERRIVEQTEWP